MNDAAHGEPTPVTPLAAPESEEPDESDADIAITAEAREESSITTAPAEAASPLPAADRSDGSNPSEPVDGEAADASPSAAATSAAAAETTTAPSFSQGTRVVQSGTAPWQWAAMVVLAFALLVQVMLADRARLATDPAWRPLLANLCGILGCSLPAWREPAAFTMLSRDVRPLSGVPDALQAQATFRNEARWTQAWPMLLVSLSDADGRVVGARAFRPDEYLAEAPQAGLAPGQSAQVVLQLREPDASVVAFAFDFR